MFLPSTCSLVAWHLRRAPGFRYGSASFSSLPLSLHLLRRPTCMSLISVESPRSKFLQGTSLSGSTLSGVGGARLHRAWRPLSTLDKRTRSSASSARGSTPSTQDLFGRQDRGSREHA